MRLEAAPPLAAGGAGCAACVDRSNERGVPVWRVAPALSLSLWPWLPVISHPLSESILGSYATRASIERPESLSVSPHFGFFFFLSLLFISPSFVSSLHLISLCVFCTIFESHLSHWGLS